MLDTDPHTRRSLAEIEGKVVDIVIKGHEDEKTGGLRLLFEAGDVRICGYSSNEGSSEREAKEDGIAAASAGEIGGREERRRSEGAGEERTGSSERPRGRARPPGPADLMIVGTPFSLLRFAASGDRQEMVLSADVALHGDAALAARLQGILLRTDIDFEELVARRIGDVPARILVRQMRGVGERLREAGSALYADLSEYLRYESDLVAKQEEGERFMRSVDDMRDDIDRLEARIALLEYPPGKGE